MTKPRILICDDEEGVRESLKLILNGHYEIELAEDGEQAVERLAQAPFDLMCLDIKMPRMDGIEALRKVRQLAPQMPVLILTAYHSTDIAKEAVRLGAQDYLSKPFDKDQVLEAIAHLLTRAKQAS